MFIKEGNAMYVQHITLDEFKKKLDSICRTTESPSQFYSIRDNIKDIILKDLILENEERMQSKDIWEDIWKCLRQKMNWHWLKQRSSGVEWSRWLEAVKKELSSLIIEHEVFDVIEYEDVPIEKRNNIYSLLVLLKRKRDQHQEITKYKARLVMDGLEHRSESMF